MEGNHLQINDIIIPIDEKIAISFNSNLADREEIVFDNQEKINPRGPIVYPINIKASPEVNAKFGYIGNPQKKGINTIIKDVLLYSDGQLVDKGIIEVLQMKVNDNRRDSEEYSLSFKAIDLGNYMAQINGKTLKDLFAVFEWTIDDNLVDDTSTYAYDTDFDLPVKDIFANPGLDIEELIVDVAMRLFPSLPYRYDQEGLWYPYPHEMLASTAIWVENEVLFDNGYFCFPSIYCKSNNELGQNTWINFYNELAPTDHKFPTYVKRRVVTDKQDPATLNYAQYDEYEALRNSLVPMFYYHQVLKHCFSDFGYELEDEFLNDEHFKKLVVFNSYDIKEAEMVWLGNIYNLEGRYNAYVWYHEKATKISPKNHLPSVEIVDFLRDFMMKFNCSFKFNGKKVSLSFQKLENVGQTFETVNPEKIIDFDPNIGLHLKYNIPSTDSTYSAITSSDIKLSILNDSTEFDDVNIGDYYLFTPSNSIYKKIDNVIANSQYICINMLPYYSGNGREFEMQFIPIINTWLDYKLWYNDHTQFYGDALAKSLIPYVNTDINVKEPNIHNFIYDRDDTQYITDTAGLIWNLYRHVYSKFGTVETERSSSETLRIGFFYGLIDIRLGGTGIPTGYKYPCLSHNNFIPGVSTPLGPWNLSLIGKYSFTKIFWRDFLGIFNNHRKITFKDYIAWQLIKNFKWEESTIINGTKYYVATINAELPITGQSQIIAYEL